MLGLRYISEGGSIYKVGLSGVGAQGQMYCIEIVDPEGNSRMLAGVPSSTDKEALEVELRNYASKNELKLWIVAEIEAGNRVLQGVPVIENDFIKLSSEELITEMKDYFDCEKQIDATKAETKRAIDEIKANADLVIDEIEDRMDYHKQCALTGIRKTEVECSWERDIETGTMYLIRRDNLKVLQMRQMTEEESQVDHLVDNV